MWYRPVAKWLAVFAIELIVSFCCAMATYRATTDIWSAFFGWLGGCVLGTCGLAAAGVRLQFSGLYRDFVDWNGRLQPPTCCPAVLQKARDAISASINGVHSGLLHDLRNGGSAVTWRDYADMLMSSLVFDERDFMATCILTPVQFMSSCFADYRGRHGPGLSRPRCMRSHFRVFIGDPKELAKEALDTTKRETLEAFFEWHREVGVKVYFISIDQFRETQTRRSEFGQLRLTDFVFFSVAGYSWVVGGEDALTQWPPTISGSTTTVHVVDQTVAVHSVEHYSDFVKALTKRARRIKGVESLRKWCEVAS